MVKTNTMEEIGPDLSKIQAHLRNMMLVVEDAMKKSEFVHAVFEEGEQLAFIDQTLKSRIDKYIKDQDAKQGDVWRPWTLTEVITSLLDTVDTLEHAATETDVTAFEVSGTFPKGQEFCFVSKDRDLIYQIRDTIVHVFPFGTIKSIGPKQ
jgi:hypothetical protein